MNEHIELVKKYLADNTSVTLEELRVNQDATWAAALWAAEAAYDAAYWAYRAAEASEHTEYCKQKARKAIARYEELIK